MKQLNNRIVKELNILVIIPIDPKYIIKKEKKYMLNIINLIKEKKIDQLKE